MTIKTIEYHGLTINIVEDQDVENPMTITRTVRYTSDPGHGWAAVKRKDLITLGIADKITHFSYQRGDTVYLEEDQDAPAFIRAARAAGWELTIVDKYVDRTPIRSYAAYDPSRPERVRAKAGDVICLESPVIFTDGGAYDTFLVDHKDAYGSSLVLSVHGHSVPIRVRLSNWQDLPFTVIDHIETPNMRRREEYRQQRLETLEQFRREGYPDAKLVRDTIIPGNFQEVPA